VTKSLFALLMLACVPGVAQQKIGIVQMQSAIVGTQEGQKAAAELEAKMAPKRKELESKQADLRALQEKAQKAGTMADPARAQLSREIDGKNKDYKRSVEDAQAQFQGEQDRLLNELGSKLMAVISKFAKDNGYSLVMDVSNPQTPVMYASETIDITKSVIDLYNKNAAVSSAPAKPAAPPSAPRPK
jgi:outer membrane protein